MAKKQRRSRSSQNEVAAIVVAATRARHGGSNSARLLNSGNATRIKRQLSDDYRPERPVTARKPAVAHAKPANVEELAHRLRAAAHHFAKFSDNTLLAACVRSLPRGRVQEALLKWCVVSFQIRWRGDTESFSGGFRGTADDLTAALAALPKALGSRRPLSGMLPATPLAPRTPNARPPRNGRQIPFRKTPEFGLNKHFAEQQQQATGTGRVPFSTLDPEDVRAPGHIKHYATPKLKR
jgi:hypothetical protein